MCAALLLDASISADKPRAPQLYNDLDGIHPKRRGELLSPGRLLSIPYPFCLGCGYCALQWPGAIQSFGLHRRGGKHSVYAHS